MNVSSPRYRAVVAKRVQVERRSENIIRSSRVSGVVEVWNVP